VAPCCRLQNRRDKGQPAVAFSDQAPCCPFPRHPPQQRAQRPNFQLALFRYWEPDEVGPCSAVEQLRLAEHHVRLAVGSAVALARMVTKESCSLILTAPAGFSPRAAGLRSLSATDPLSGHKLPYASNSIRSDCSLIRFSEGPTMGLTLPRVRCQ